MPGLTVPLPKPTILQPGEQENQLVQGYRDESAALPTRLEPIRQQMDTLGTQMQQVGESMPRPPTLAPIQEFRPRQVDGGEMMAFATMATVLASLGARATRTGITGALTAAGSAMQGFNQGNLQQAKLDAENFTTQMRATIANNNQMLSEYQAVLEDRKLTLAQKMQQYSVLAHKFQDEIAISAIKRGDIRFELERLDKLRAGSNNLELQYSAIEAKIQAMVARLEASQANQLDKPLNAADLVHYVHPQTGARPEPGATLRDVIRGGFQVQSTNEQSRGSDVQGATAVVNRLAELTNKLWGEQGADKAGSGVLGRAGTAAAWSYQRLTQENESLSLYDAFVKGTVAPLIRSLGEKGTLATEDVARALNLLPNAGSPTQLPDSPEIARGKINQLRQLLQNARGPTGAGGTSRFAEGQTATGPGGARIVFRNGRWVPQ